jgi:hypothetical protein
MHQSWIKSLPITPVKFVNIIPAPSCYACNVQILIVFVTLWAFAVAPFPFVICLLLITLFGELLIRDNILLRSILEPCRYSDDGMMVFHSGKQKKVERIYTLYARWCLIVVYRSGEPSILWRDSCADAVYRQIIVMEKRRRYLST